MGTHILAGNRNQGHRVDLSRVETGDEVGSAGARGTDGQSHLARGSEVAIGGMDRAFLVAGNVVFDFPRGRQVPVDGVDSSAGDAEGGVDSFALQNPHNDLCHTHSTLSLRRCLCN